MKLNSLTTDEQVAELRKMLGDSTGHDYEVVRPCVVVGMKVDPDTGKVFAVHGPGPVTVVTFYISHRYDQDQPATQPLV